jgi:hypothetical protein
MPGSIGESSPNASSNRSRFVRLVLGVLIPTLPPSISVVPAPAGSAGLQPAPVVIRCCRPRDPKRRPGAVFNFARVGVALIYLPVSQDLA